MTDYDDDPYVVRNDAPFPTCDFCENPAPYEYHYSAYGGDTWESEHYCASCAKAQRLDFRLLPVPTQAEFDVPQPPPREPTGMELLMREVWSVEDVTDQFDKGALLLDVLEGKQR